MGQQTVDEKELAEAMNLGIECFVKVTSNKVDEAKENIRSICLNFDPHVQMEGERTRIGTGNNLNINNVRPEQYRALCRALGVESIDEDTPVVAVIYKPADKAKLEEWATQRARQDNDVDEKQQDITKDPNLATGKQVKAIGVIQKKKEGADEVIAAALGDAGKKKVEELTIAEASDLIKALDTLEDKPKEEEPAEEPKKRGRPPKDKK